MQVDWEVKLVNVFKEKRDKKKKYFCFMNFYQLSTHSTLTDTEVIWP